MLKNSEVEYHASDDRSRVTNGGRSGQEPGMVCPLLRIVAYLA